MIKDDLCAMLDELAELPQKAVNSDLFEHIHLDVHDGDTPSEPRGSKASVSESDTPSGLMGPEAAEDIFEKLESFLVGNFTVFVLAEDSAAFDFLLPCAVLF
jgi:hypothetical protein